MKTTTQGIELTLTAMKRMTVAQLRDKYLEVFAEATRSGNKDFLLKRIAWRMQSLAEGGLSDRARRRADELARDADIRTTVPRPQRETHAAADRTEKHPVPGNLTSHDRLPVPGTILTRKYRGQNVAVKVLPQGFDYGGQIYRSLSAVAKVITGSHWNGLLFFGLTRNRNHRSDHEQA